MYFVKETLQFAVKDELVDEIYRDEVVEAYLAQADSPLEKATAELSPTCL